VKTLILLAAASKPTTKKERIVTSPWQKWVCENTTFQLLTYV